MNVVGIVCFLLLGAAGVLCLARAVRPGTLADRAVALDTTVALVVCGLAVAVAVTGDGIFVDLALVAGLLGFLGTTAVARYVGRRGL
ncbi:MAG: sodium:proton antiporter [Acidimicrobiia bacterium]|nr:sodium:proton antiporter [Acidimicrobiia bacterium]